MTYDIMTPQVNSSYVCIYNRSKIYSKYVFLISQPYFIGLWINWLKEKDTALPLWENSRTAFSCNNCGNSCGNFGPFINHVRNNHYMKRLTFDNSELPAFLWRWNTFWRRCEIKHRKNCECCHHHSVFKGHNAIVHIVVLNCQKCN